jgi:hypothetical protein
MMRPKLVSFEVCRHVANEGGDRLWTVLNRRRIQPAPTFNVAARPSLALHGGVNNIR